MTDRRRVAVLGGGVTGLCTAYYLAREYPAEDIVLIDSGAELGGQTRTLRTDGFVCDWGPNGFLDREPLTLQWIDDLGAGDRLVRADAAAARRFILRDGRLLEVPLSPPRFLTSPLLSLPGRLRVLCEPLVRSRTSRAESLWSFGARRIGREAADFLIDPMASGIFGGASKHLSLAACFPAMEQMEQEYGSLFQALLAKKKARKNVRAAGPAGVLTSFAEGIGYLPERVETLLSCEIRKRTKLTGLARHGDGFVVHTEQGALESKAVVVCLPAYAAAELTAGWDDELSRALNSISFAPIVVLCAGYRREHVGHDLDGFGFLVPRAEGQRVLGCIWTSSVFPGRAPEGWVQLRTMYGGATDPAALNCTDRELIDLFKKEVGSLLAILDDPEFIQIFRWPRAIPQYNIGHLESVERIESAEVRFPGLAFAGNSYRGVGLNDCVVSAHRAIARIRPIL